MNVDAWEDARRKQTSEELMTQANFAQLLVFCVMSPEAMLRSVVYCISCYLTRHRRKLLTTLPTKYLVETSRLCEMIRTANPRIESISTTAPRLSGYDYGPDNS